MSDIQEVFAANVRSYRKGARMTQEELAEKSGLHRTYIGGIEQQRVNVSLKNIEKIAQALDVDPALLFVHEKPGAQDSGARKAKAVQPPSALQWDHALCTRTDERGIMFEPLDVHDEDLTISILCALINEGTNDNLIEAYNRAQAEIIDFFRSAHRPQNAPH